jgi:hypothetical protein
MRQCAWALGSAAVHSSNRQGGMMLRLATAWPSQQDMSEDTEATRAQENISMMHTRHLWHNASMLHTNHRELCRRLESNASSMRL